MVNPTKCIPDISRFELWILKKNLFTEPKKNLFIQLKKSVFLHLLFSLGINSKILLNFKLTLLKKILCSEGLSVFKKAANLFGVLFTEKIFFTKQIEKLLPFWIFLNFFKILNGLKLLFYPRVYLKTSQIKKNLRILISDSIFGQNSSFLNVYGCFFGFFLCYLRKLNFKTYFFILKYFFLKVNLRDQKKSSFVFLVSEISLRILRVFSKKISHGIKNLHLNLEKSLFGKKHHLFLKFFCQENLIKKINHVLFFKKKINPILFYNLEKTGKIWENYFFFKQKKFLHQKNIFLDFKKIFCTKTHEKVSWNLPILLGLFLKSSPWKKVFIYPLSFEVSREDPLNNFWKIFLCLIFHPTIFFKFYLGGTKLSGVHLGNIFRTKSIQRIFQTEKTYFFKKVFYRNFSQINSNKFAIRFLKPGENKTYPKIIIDSNRNISSLFFFNKNLNLIQLKMGLNDSYFFFTNVRIISRDLFSFYSKFLKWKVFKKSKFLSIY